MSTTVAIAYDWAVRCFGRAHVHNRKVRALRVAEEAVELAQSLRVEKERLHALIDIVYARKIGKPAQEVGGVMMTLSVLCGAMGVDREAEFERELRRVLNKPVLHFTRRNQEKIGMGLGA